MTRPGPGQVATVAVEPPGPPEPVGDLLALHAAAGLQLRVLPTLWPSWNAVTASTLQFSAVRRLVSTVCATVSRGRSSMTRQRPE